MKKYSGLFVIIGFCAFIALMASGIIWILSLFGISGGILGTIGYIAHIILIVIACFSGWLWISSAKMNHTLKVVLEVLFIIFAIMAICGVCGVHFQS